MSTYSTRVLTHQPARLALTVGGMALCVLLMLFLLAIYQAVSDGSVEYVRRSNADVWVLQENATNILRSTSFLSTRHESDLLDVEGVEEAARVLLQLPTLHARGRSATVFLAGYNTGSGLGGPPMIAEGRSLRADDEIVLDRSFAARMRLRLGDSVQVQDEHLRVVGLSTGTNAFVIQYAFVRLATARAIFGFPAIVTCYLVKAAPGTSPAVLRERIERALPDVSVFDQQEFLANNIRETENGVLPILYVVALIGTVVLTIILSLLLTINILERRRDFAVMKMLGAGKHYPAGPRAGAVRPHHAGGLRRRLPPLLARHALRGVDLSRDRGGRDAPARAAGPRDRRRRRRPQRPLLHPAGAAHLPAGGVRMTSARAPLCELDRVTRSYGASGPAVREVSLDVVPGEMVLLVGPSGSGKTTLLTLIAGLLRPDSGAVRLFGEDLSTCSPDRMQQVRARRIGFVFQTFQLLDALTAVENVALALRFGGVRGAEANRRAHALLLERGIGHLAHKKPGAMSQGEKQRVAIARATANQPDLILADEPTASLETTQGLAIIQLLRAYALTEGRGVVVATHDPRMTEFASRVVRIEDGRVVADTRAAPRVSPVRDESGPPCRVRRATRDDNEALFELIDSNPIVTDFAYVTDRRPDFFGLHPLFPDSCVLVGDDLSGEAAARARPPLESCCSRMAYEGRLGDRIGRFDHSTDLCRRPTAKVRGLLRGVLNAQRAVLGGRGGSGHHRPGEQGEPAATGHPPESRQPAAGLPRGDVRPHRGGTARPVRPRASARHTRGPW